MRALVLPGQRVEAFAAQQGAGGTLVAASLVLTGDGGLVLGGEFPGLAGTSGSSTGSGVAAGTSFQENSKCVSNV